MSDPRTDAEIDALIEPILRAAGTSLRHFSMHMAREGMRAAMRAALDRKDAENAALREAGFKLTAALAQLPSTSKNENSPEYLGREAVMDLVIRWRMQVDALGQQPHTEPANKLVWVIEKGSPAQYFQGFDYGAGKWTPDFSEALQAADREVMQRLWDCDQPIFTIFNDACRIADHMICDGPQPHTERTESAEAKLRGDWEDGIR